MEWRKKKKERDAILAHEIGHGKMHFDNPLQNKKFISEPVMISMYKNRLAVLGINPNSQAGKDAIEAMRKDEDWKRYLGTKMTDENLDKMRNKFLEHAKKYLKHADTNRHLNYSEIEADRAGANKTDSKTMSRALRHITKYTMKDKNLNKTLAAAGVTRPELAKRMKAKIRSDSKVDIDRRTKALKDKDLEKYGSIYKNESSQNDLFEEILEKYNDDELTFEEANILVEALYSR